MSRASEGFVYYMQCADTMRIKIGHSMEPKRRLAAINSGAPTLIELVATEPGGTDVEVVRHHEFRAALVAHVTGREWFYPVPELLDLVRHLGGEPRGGPVPPGVVPHSVGSRPEAPVVLGAEGPPSDIGQVEGLVQDLLLLHHEAPSLRKGYRHGYRMLSRALLADVEFLRSWIRPTVEEIRGHGARDPVDITRDPATVLPSTR